MLYLGKQSISEKIDQDKFISFKKTKGGNTHRKFARFLTAMLVIFLIAIFLPWTQNIQTEGKVTTLYPGERPQTVHATIAGRIEEWYVREGDLVKKGDTIARLSEIKAEYFDPQLVDRTQGQVSAKEASVLAYDSKIRASEAQVVALKEERIYKLNQLRNKVRQAFFKISSDSLDVIAAKLDDDVAKDQLVRMEKMFKDDLRSLTDLETRKRAAQTAAAKYNSAQNKLADSRQELNNARLQISTTENEYATKISKAESDLYSALSAKLETEGSVQKLRIDYENYKRRQSFYIITAPIDGQVTESVINGVGETVKEGDPIVNIIPVKPQLAVEMFVKPMDLPLLQKGKEVRFIFDGWPAFIFSGWPGQSFGTYAGEIFAIDQNVNQNGLYRVLIAPYTDTKNIKPWPDALRVGGGAQCIALLNDVPLWYELWRQLNGFPPDFYKQFGADKPSTPKKK